MSNRATTRSTTGQFLPGRSGNPAGRPLGARNRTSLWRELLDEGEDEAIVRAVIDRALAGHWPALRACFDRLLPKPKDAPIELDLPEIASVADVAEASSALIAAVAAGELTPNEGQAVMKLLLAQMKILAMAEQGDRTRGEARTTAKAPSSADRAAEVEPRRHDGCDPSPAADAAPLAAAADACISPVPAAAPAAAPAPVGAGHAPRRTADSLYFPCFEQPAASLDTAGPRPAPAAASTPCPEGALAAPPVPSTLITTPLFRRLLDNARPLDRRTSARAAPLERPSRPDPARDRLYFPCFDERFAA